MPGWPWRSTPRASGTWSWTPTGASRREWAPPPSAGRDRDVDVAPGGVGVRAHLMRGLGRRAGPPPRYEHFVAPLAFACWFSHGRLSQPRPVRPGRSRRPGRRTVPGPAPGAWRGSGGGVVVFEQDRGEALMHVPGEVVGEHADQHVGADPAGEPVADGADEQVGVQAAEDAFDVFQGLVGLHRACGGQGVWGEAG